MVNKLILDSSVKPLQMAVSFGMSGIIEEMHQPFFLAGFLKVFGKLNTIVGLNSHGGKRDDFEELIEEITATS